MAGPDVPDLAGLCHTSRIGRREFRERLAVLAADHDQLARRLRSIVDGHPADGTWTGTATTGSAVGTGATPADLAAAWVTGAPVDWPGTLPAPRRVAFPTYPFTRRRYWIGASETAPAQPLTFHRPVWTVSERSADGTAGGPHVVVDLTGDLAADLERLLDAVRDGLAAHPDSPLRVLATHTVDHPAHSAVAAALRTLAMEHGRVTATLVGTGDVSPAVRAERVNAELDAADAVVRYRDGVREVRSLAGFEPPRVATDPAALVRPGGTYVITGGAGALGRHVARFLSTVDGVTLVLAGRSAPSPDLDAELAGLSRAGTRVLYHRCDVSTVDGVRGLVAAARAHGPLRGVVHAAGVTRDRLAPRKTREDVAAVLAPKVTGTELLDAATRTIRSTSSCCSRRSSRSRQPGPGRLRRRQRVPGRVRRHRAARGRGERSGRTVAIGWPLWADGGMSVTTRPAGSSRGAGAWCRWTRRPACRARARGRGGGRGGLVVATPVAGTETAAAQPMVHPVGPDGEAGRRRGPVAADRVVVPARGRPKR